MKILTHFTVEKEIANNFNLLARELSINKSRFVENRIKEFIELNKEILKKIKENENRY